MLLTLLLCTLAATGCGGSADDPDTGLAASPSAAVAAAAPASAPDAGMRTKAADVEAGAATVVGVEAPTPDKAALAVTASGDQAAPPAQLKRAAQLTSLALTARDASLGLRAVAATPLCAAGFVPPTDLTRTTAAPLPAAGAVFFNATEASTWRGRVRNGPFVNDADYAATSPGDWVRIRANAARFIAAGEPLAGDDESSRSRHGGLARDAAFTYLMAPESKLLAAVREWLLAQAADASNDFATHRCFTDRQGVSRDGFFAEAPWLARFIASYDFVRSALPSADRVRIENYIRRNAWFFATQLDWGLREIFPQRLAGSYTQRAESAASTGEAIWWTRRVDSNGSCGVDGADDARAYPVYTHVRADGSLGNKVPVLAVWFNNRRAANALAVGAAGLLLGDGDLVERAKRYTMEWLTWGVFGDGATSEMFRNGEYCVARQGVIYGAMNVQSGVMLARLLARQGDRSLMNFSTRDGAFGTQSATGAPPKSLALAAQALLGAATGSLDWYAAEPNKTVQQPRAATALGRARLNYMGGATPMDSLHELSLLSSAAAVASVPVADTLLRHALISGRAATPNVPVVTGLGTWSDAFGVLPAAYLLRP